MINLFTQYNTMEYSKSGRRLNICGTTNWLDFEFTLFSTLIRSYPSSQLTHCLSLFMGCLTDQRVTWGHIHKAPRENFGTELQQNQKTSQFLKDYVKLQI